MKASTKRKLKSRCPRRLWKAAVNTYYGLMRIKHKFIMQTSGSLPYECPCCGIKLRSFIEGMDYKAFSDFYDVKLFDGVRQDVVCPVCSSLPRHRILAKWCEENKDKLVSSKILYFAPERGMTTWLKANKIRYTTADLFAWDVDLKLDIQATNLPDESYDVVICNHVLEHVDDYMTALKEIRRILSPDGILLCSFPVSPDVEFIDEDREVVTEEGRLRRYGQSDHLRLFGMKADTLLAEAYYEVSVLDGDTYPGSILPVTGPCLYDINRLFLCKKTDEIRENA